MSDVLVDRLLQLYWDKPNLYTSLYVSDAVPTLQGRLLFVRSEGVSTGTLWKVG